MKTHPAILIGLLHGTPFYSAGWLQQFYVMSLILPRTAVSLCSTKSARLQINIGRLELSLLSEVT